MFSPRAVHTVCLEEQCWDTGKRNTGPSYSPLIIQCMLVLIVASVCAALGTGQLYQPRKQTGDRENASGRTVSSL